MTPSPRESRWRAVLREPLLHFFVVGAAIFALHRSMDHALPGTPIVGARDAAPLERRLIVTRAVRDEVTRALRTERSREPSRAEIDAAVARWIDDEVLYREGRARGFEQDDPRVRARVASKMAYVLGASAVLPEPTDAELRAWIASHAERFRVPERVDFTHVFVRADSADPADRAEILRIELARGASPNRLGDTFSGGRHYRGRTFEDLRETFGASFADGVRAQSIGEWSVQASRYGRHVVRVERRSAATGITNFAALRADARHDWLEERRRAETRRAVARLRARWDVVREP